jgi:hypothetical protein
MSLPILQHAIIRIWISGHLCFAEINDKPVFRKVNYAAKISNGAIQTTTFRNLMNPVPAGTVWKKQTNIFARL